MKIIITTTSQYKIGILIDPNKTVKELIKFYFETIKRPELFGDKSITFIWSANVITHDSNTTIKSHLNKRLDNNTIVVDDEEGKKLNFIKLFIK